MNTVTKLNVTPCMILLCSGLKTRNRGGWNRIGRREKWPKKSWEEGEIGGKSREEGEKETKPFREEGEIG